MNKTPLWKQLVISALLGALAFSLWHYRSQITALWHTPAPMVQNSAPSDSGVPVLVAPVALADDSLSFTAVGTGHALRSITLRAPASGEITEMNITAGQPFKAGDVLIRLDDIDQRLAADLAEARQERAASEQRRYSGLNATGTTTAVKYEDAMTAARIAMIELERARSDLADRVLLAPFDGIAGLATVESGDRIALGDAIASFDDRSRILVEFDLPEALLPRIRPGMAVQAYSRSADVELLEGEISAIDSRVTPVSRTARVRAVFRNSTDKLRPGASFVITLELPGGRYPVLPELALQFERGKTQVWRITAEGRAEPVEVRLIRRRAGTVIIDGPLAEGELVVVEGLQRMRPGRAVDILNKDDQPGAT